MRELKFRAWDKDTKCMVEVDSIHLPLGKPSGKDITVYNQELECYEWVYNYELMQNTGLIDTEGKEIYEGDIIKEKYYAYSNKPPSKSYGIIKRENKNCNLYIEFNFQDRYEGEVFWNKNELYINKACEYEVIGNIYENPELLEGR